MAYNPILKLNANESVDAVLVYDEGLYQEPRPPYNNVQYRWTIDINGEQWTFFASELTNQQLLQFRQGDMVNIFKGQRGYEVTGAGGNSHAPQPRQAQRGRPPQQRPQQGNRPQQGRPQQQRAGGTQNSLQEFSNSMAGYFRALKIAKFIQLKYELGDAYHLNAAAFTIASMAKSAGFNLTTDPIDNWLPVLSDDGMGGDQGLFMGLSRTEREVLEAHFGRSLPNRGGEGRDQNDEAAGDEAEAYDEFPPEPEDETPF